MESLCVDVFSGSLRHNLGAVFSLDHACFIIGSSPWTITSMPPELKKKPPCNPYNACNTMGSQFSMAIAFTFRASTYYPQLSRFRAIETDPIHRAGLTRATGARSGIVTLVQRFGNALYLNIR